MENEKIIEEMANFLWHIPDGYCLNSYNDCKIIAESIYEQDYRKVVMCCECKYCEVVIDSIIDEPKYFCTRMVGCMPVDPTDYCSRAKMKGAE